MDIARYKPQSTLEARGLNRRVFYNCGLASSHMGLDSDLDGLDNKVRAGGRYYLAKYAVLERNKGFKHLKVLKRDVIAILPEDFIPVETPSLPAKSTTAQQECEESWEDEILQRTKELNKMTRECPHDEKIWLAFAQFQDKVASTQPQKAAHLQTTERKISILEKAVELSNLLLVFYFSQPFPLPCLVVNKSTEEISFASESQDKVASTQPQKAAHLQTTERKLVYWRRL